MDAHRFDHLAKGLGAAGSRRWAIGGFLGGMLGLSRIGAAGAGHKLGHHCTPSDKHACPEGQTCREVSGEWTCQGTCLLGAVCATDNDCCAPLCCDNPTGTLGVCDTDCFD